jgi:hypothetical protein
VSNNEFGDFQTPRELAALALKAIPRREWSRVLEPTCGIGNFLHESVASFPGAHTVGIEVQEEYVEVARHSSAEVLQADIFGINLGKYVSWRNSGPLLVVGNPPWVTNAQLSRLESDNRPARTNLKNLSGYDAMTGSSNFDIAEYIWLKLIKELQSHRPTISLLCKTLVARNVLEYSAKFGLPVSHSTMHMIDAKKWFNVSVDACLFTVTVNDGPPAYTCQLYDSIESRLPTRTFGVVDGRLIADVDAYEKGCQVDGNCPLEWRQGMKHDAAAVMELIEDSGPTTKSGEKVAIEDGYLYPLLKCTDVFRDRLELSKWVVVPQRTLGEDTKPLAHVAPNLWSYLTQNAAALDGRKSSIYRSQPRFAVFGLGDYSFAPYKIAVSGLHKSAEFRLVGPIDGKPVFFDDTCYLLAFDDPTDAAIVYALLDTEQARNFFRSLAFWDAKRPITKKLLQRIDLRVVADTSDIDEVATLAQKALSRLGVIETEESIRLAYARLRAKWGGGDSTSLLEGDFATTLF